MREVVTRERVARVMVAFGAAADVDTRVYFTGGVTAVLIGWRSSTIDVALLAVPETGALLRSIPSLKETLSVNVELVSPAHFIPVPSGWESRSPFITQHGRVSFHHYDLYAQALAKLERRHVRDVTDAQEMIARGLIEPKRALDYFAQIELELYRFPAVDPPSFRKAVESMFGLRSTA